MVQPVSFATPPSQPSGRIAKAPPVSLGAQLAASHPPLPAPRHFFEALWEFCRPHTIKGTLMGVASISVVSLGVAGLCTLTTEDAKGIAYLLSSALLMNVAVVGINQVYDVDIDRVNKPYLPLAAGDFSVRMGAALSVGSALASLALCFASGSRPLMWTLSAAAVLGAAYSVEAPLLRWKRHPATAAAAIAIVRALLVQLGFFAHVTQTRHLALGSRSELRRPGQSLLSLLAAAPPSAQQTIGFATLFMILFTAAIAMFKDLPDARGDAQAGMKTLTVRIGPTRVLWLCTALLTSAYGGG